jgi:hypothetical protein
MCHMTSRILHKFQFFAKSYNLIVHQLQNIIDILFVVVVLQSFYPTFVAPHV